MEERRKTFIGKRLMAIAIMFLLMGIYFIGNDIVKTSGKEKISATICDVVRNEYRSDLKRGYYVYVDYSFDGKEHKNVYVGNFPYPWLSIGSEGEQCFVYVDKNNPESIEFANFYTIALIPTAIVLGVVGYRLMGNARKEE